MGIGIGLSLILLSILAVPSLILSKKPDAKELIDKIAPYQGWIGLIGCLWGVWGIIHFILNIGMIGSLPIWWIVAMAASVTLAALGFILGYNLIAKYALSKNEAAKAKGEALLQKLASVQGKLGILGLILGALTIVVDIIY